MSSNRVDLSSSVSLHIEVFPLSYDFVLTSIGLARYASAPCRPLDARISCLIRFPMNCPPSEDDFLFISSRFELLQSGVPERGVTLADSTSSPGASQSYDIDLPGAGM